jgi:hypothetical protein
VPVILGGSFAPCSNGILRCRDEAAGTANLGIETMALTRKLPRNSELKVD